MKAPRVDANQKDVVNALRKVGALVQHLHGVGQGCPDLLVGHGGILTLVEVKDGSKPPSARKLTPQQEDWHAFWEGYPVFIAETPEEAVNLILGRTQGVL